MRWIAGLLAAGVTLVVPNAVAQSVRSGPIEVRSRPIETFRIGSTETRFGPLEFVGGLEMTSAGRDFGSMSSFRFRNPGKDFIGVADTGFWYFGSITHDGDGRPTGVTSFSMEEMVDDAGQPIRSKWDTDGEGLAIRDDIATVSFERAHRLSEFVIAPGQMRAAKRDLDFIIPRGELRQNKGMETVVYAPEDGPLKGARVVVSERSVDGNGDIFAAIIEGAGKGIFKVRRMGAFDITDGAFLPGGDLLLLERAFSMAEGVRMRLRRVPGSDIRKGAVVEGEILMAADMAYQIDNMEGLDVWTRDDGATMVSLVSDDNHSILQRNLYLEFRLVD